MWYAKPSSQREEAEAGDQDGQQREAEHVQKSRIHVQQCSVANSLGEGEWEKGGAGDFWGMASRVFLAKTAHKAKRPADLKGLLT